MQLGSYSRICISVSKSLSFIQKNYFIIGQKLANRQSQIDLRRIRIPTRNHTSDAFNHHLFC